MPLADPALEARILVDSGALSLFELWLHFWGEGGQVGEMELDAFIHGIPMLQDFDVTILGWALEPLLPPGAGDPNREPGRS